MVEFKLVISNPKTGLSVQKDAKDDAARQLVGLKIGDKVGGEPLGFGGFEFEVSGGSDYCGFPMRKDIPGVGRKRVLAVSGVGFRMAAKGIRQRKTVCGNTIHERTAQVNLKVLKEGKDNIFEPAEKKAAENKAAKEAKKAEHAAKKEAKAAERPAEKPAEKVPDKPAEKPAEKHAEKPAGKPLEKAEGGAAGQKPAESEDKPAAEPKKPRQKKAEPAKEEAAE
ncbi:30S ribosomal protein S6e [Candidatus Woesearchaeota archaeon]|nr:30S ribosomal protein S6e [Candidatus Woesearchaeota archaeon]